ncbi:MAG: hypothetical protein ACUVUB_07495, partial [Candidatus Bathyarchaeia archaeon]
IYMSLYSCFNVISTFSEHNVLSTSQMLKYDFDIGNFRAHVLIIAPTLGQEGGDAWKSHQLPVYEC